MGEPAEKMNARCPPNNLPVSTFGGVDIWAKPILKKIIIKYENIIIRPIKLDAKCLYESAIYMIRLNNSSNNVATESNASIPTVTSTTKLKNNDLRIKRLTKTAISINNY